MGETIGNWANKKRPRLQAKLERSSSVIQIVPFYALIAMIATNALRTSAFSSRVISRSGLRRFSTSMRTDFTTVFDLDLPFGRCIGVQKNEATSLEHWHPEEIAFANILASNRESFLLGRLALRQMIDTSQPILRTEHGAPDIPSGWMASVSHKRDVGVALVAPAEPNVYVGVDVELQSSRRNIARKILTEREQGELGKLEGINTDQEVLLRFSLKEALYKALHPTVCRYISFKEVEISPLSEGNARARLLFGACDTSIDLQWTRLDEFFLTTCRATTSL